MQAPRHVQNILVTGGAGFIGSAFIRYLLSTETKFAGTCVNLDVLTYAGNLENSQSIEQDHRYVFEKGDIRNEALVEHLCQEHQIDTIIHFAAESHVDRSILGPQAFIETNIMGTFHLLEVAKRHPKIHFHHVSTDEVYGSLGPTGYFTEETLSAQFPLFRFQSLFRPSCSRLSPHLWNVCVFVKLQQQLWALSIS